MPAAEPPIYLDHNATTPMLPEVLEAMRAVWSGPAGNPASQHRFGRRARRLLEDARERIAELVGANASGPDADRLVFTSGGTEANHLALGGLLGDRPAGQFIVSSIEHPSVLATADRFERRGWRVERLGVDRQGVIHSDHLSPAIVPDTCLVAAMLANNETGVVQPIGTLASICHRHGVPLHTDAAQAVGKLGVGFRELGVATMSIAAHKFHGPLGIGALVVRHGIELVPQLSGGFQQGGLRPGSESVALAVGMRQALELYHAEQDRRWQRLQTLRDRFEQALCHGWPEAIVIGADAPRLPHTTNIALVGLERQALFVALDQAGVACSTGSACASGSSEPSPALLAMGCPRPWVDSALRFSLGAATTAAEVDEAARRILNVCNSLRQRKLG